MSEPKPDYSKGLLYNLGNFLDHYLPIWVVGTVPIALGGALLDHMGVSVWIIVPIQMVAWVGIGHWFTHRPLRAKESSKAPLEGEAPN